MYYSLLDLKDSDQTLPLGAFSVTSCDPSQVSEGFGPDHSLLGDDYLDFRRYMAAREEARRQAKPQIAAPKTKSRKKSKPRRQAKTTTPMLWLRQQICSLVYGEKMPVGVRPSLEKKTLIGLWNMSLPIRKLPNYRLADHFSGEDTLYFFGNGKVSARYTLAMIDIDVQKSKGRGSPEGARAFAEYLKKNFWPDLYFERSTNGKGIHAYIRVWKCGVGAEAVNKSLRRLQTWLQAEAKKVGADIELVEVKGTCPEITFDGRTMLAVKYGQFAKLLREVQRFQEWQATTILRWDELQSSRFDVKPEPVTKSENIQIVSPPGAGEKKKQVIVAGSITGKVICDEELANIPKFEGLYRAWVRGRCLKAGKWKVTDHDFAVAMIILRHFQVEPNKDDSLPYRRAGELWTKLYENGDVTRPWNHHRWKAIRQFLSENGHINWIDIRYEPPGMKDGTVVRGIACKWRLTEDFAVVLDRVAALPATQRGKASFVDTRFRQLVPSPGRGRRLRPERYPLRWEMERKFWFRAYEACENLCAA